MRRARAGAPARSVVGVARRQAGPGFGGLRRRWQLGRKLVLSGNVSGTVRATRVLSFHSTVAVATATLVAAALFNPLRRRVQFRVDRRFNRARYDADQMVAAFSGRLKDAVDLDSVRDDLAGVVQQALEPAHISVWVSRST